MNEVLGWKLLSIKGRVIEKGKHWNLIQGQQKTVLCLEEIQTLSNEEARFLQEVLVSLTTKKHAVEEAIKAYGKEQHIEITKKQEAYLRSHIKLALHPEECLHFLLEEERIEEIAVLGKEKPVHVYMKKKGWVETNIIFTSNEKIRDLANKIGRKIGRRLSTATPTLNAYLENARLNAIDESIALTGTALTIRKFASKRMHALDLLQYKVWDTEMLAFLWMAMQADTSFIIAGNTGSGKTTTLNALLDFIPNKERILIIEETPEINCLHEHQVRLVKNQAQGIGLEALIENTLRMRPDRVIVGELRNAEEVRAFNETMLAGQGKGSCATFHALHGQEFLQRIITLGMQEMDVQSLDFMIVQRRWSQIENGKMIEKRKIIEINEIHEEENRTVLKPLYAFDFKKKMFQKKNESLKVKEKIKTLYGLSEEGFQKELRAREKRIEEMKGEDGKTLFTECSTPRIIAGSKHEQER
jgi:pilus assembly protein CpaF